MPRYATYDESHVSKDSINWGGHDDPRGLLVPGVAYEVEWVEVHSYHTKIHLKDFPNAVFNSVWFPDLDIEPDIRAYRG